MRKMIPIVVFACLVAGAAGAQQSSETEPAPAVAPQVDPTAEPGPPQPAPNPVVLRVNGSPIHAVEISMIMQTIQSQFAQRGEQVDQRELAKVATQRAIEQKLLVQEARRFGAEPDELDVARAAQIAEQQAGGREALEAKLEAAGSSYEQFLGVIREIETLKVFADRQIKPNVTITDEEIATFYRDNPELFEAEDRVHAAHMIFVASEDSSAETQAAARARAEAARQRALTGDEDFATVARELSEGPSAPTGGDLGWVTRGALVDPLSDTVFSLEPGEISEVVQSRFGYHVLTISDRRPAETISLEDASDQIEDLLRNEKATETLGELLQTLVENAEVENLLGGDRD